jgi:hypothetical protein
MKKSIATLLSLCLVFVAMFAVSADAATKRGPRGKQGPRGLRGLTGPAGPAGPKGDTGPAGSGGSGADRIDFRGDAGSPLKVLYNKHGLQLQAQCTNSGPGLLNTLRAKASEDNGSLVAYAIGLFQNPGGDLPNEAEGGGAIPAGAAPQRPTISAFNDTDFDAGDADTIFDLSPRRFVAGVVIDYAAADGSAVTVNALYSDAGPNVQPQDDCVFVGTAVDA